MPGDDPAVIGSGPSVPDPTTLADARAVIARYRLNLPDTIGRAVNDPANESPKPDDPAFAHTKFSLVARPADAFAAASAKVRSAGYECIVLGDRMEGEASVVAAEHAALARDLKAQGTRAVILSGGELTVTIRGDGRGGPNQEYALALASHFDGAKGIAALAADTDGTDGGAGSADDPAGAYVDADTVARAPRGRPRSSRFPAEQRFHRFFCGTVGPRHDRPHVHKCQRFPCDTCRQGMIP